MALSFVGGMVDGVGYLSLGHLFIGFMSGNSIKLGLQLGRGQWHEALRFLLPIAMFLFGVILGGLLFELAHRRRVRSPVALLLGIETLSLAAYIACSHWLMPSGRLASPQQISFGFVLLVALLTLAMGLQTAALQHIGSHSVHTTFVTGMLTDLARQTATYLLRSMAKPVGDQGWLPEKIQPAWSWLLAEIWIVYVAGAAAGAYGLGRVSVKVLFIPILLLIFLIVMMLRFRAEPTPGGREV